MNLQIEPVEIGNPAIIAEVRIIIVGRQMIFGQLYHRSGAVSDGDAPMSREGFEQPELAKALIHPVGQTAGKKDYIRRSDLAQWQRLSRNEKAAAITLICGRRYSLSAS